MHDNTNQEVRQEDCPNLPATILRIYLPPGTEINLANIIQVISPGGVCLLVRLPFLELLGSTDLAGANINIMELIKNAGGTVETV